jgi:hypothetical protein
VKLIHFIGDRSFLPDELFEDDDIQDDERLTRLKLRTWVDDKPYLTDEGATEWIALEHRRYTSRSYGISHSI